MANTIREYVAERGISRVVHFTQERNLGSILHRGLITKDALGGHVEGCNDEHRIDGTHAVCASIGFPNYKMFYRLRQSRPDHQWVVLELDPAILWERVCAFCAANAAKNSVRATPLAERQTLGALQGLFCDLEDKTRQSLGLPDGYPTNPQAEVLILNGVPRASILRVTVPHEQARLRVATAHPSVTPAIATDYFNARRDHQHW